VSLFEPPCKVLFRVYFWRVRVPRGSLLSLLLCIM